ncbi:MAG: VPS10 domain-containing protein [Planctomycetota bacterium]
MLHPFLKFWLAVSLAVSSVAVAALSAQGPGAGPDDGFLKGFEYRLLGPFRGGRSAAVEGVIGQPQTYYMGTTGGGVWRTDDGGTTWRNISDGYFGGSIGAVAAAPSDPNILYVGGGEVTVRGNVSSGQGMWKSIDGGKTWKAIGLEDSRHIPRIRVHPKDPNLVYVAALGHLYGPNRERGVFRSRDGGATWEKVLYVNDEVGACDLIIDPSNPRVLYASTWRVLRTPYSLESGGPGSGLWKSSDGGDTWEEISRRPGLPGGTLGIIGVAVSPVDSNRVWAIIEADDGGLFRSDDAGATWQRINDDRNLRQRAWYYSRVYAGPKDREEVYVVNVEFWRSEDGGKKFNSISTPHGDHHDLWIDPADPDRMSVGDDGGAQVSFNRGATFSTYENQPTAQFYRVVADNHFPYRIYGAQQDNSTVRLSHRSSGGFLDERSWEQTAGGESGHIAPDPKNPEIVYGGSFGGYLTRINHQTGESRTVNVWPDNPMGYGARDIKFRFQWNFPILFSRHDPQTLYAAGNALFKTTDEGQSWTQISGDLTRNDPSKMGPSGGPITKDNTGVEYYCTIFAVAESALEQGVIWTGSDDGLLHVTRDAGQTWTNVTPPDLPNWAQINSIEAHPFEPGGLYVAATCYKSDDFRPYLFRTTDFGKTWTKLVTGIGREDFTRVVRADPVRRGLLFAGTENGMYLSYDDGNSWRRFQNNLPLVPVTDLTIKDGDLIVATQGRSFWALDDLTLLRTWDPAGFDGQPHLLGSRPVYRMDGGAGRASATAGANLRAEIPLRFVLGEFAPAKAPRVTLAITDYAGRPVNTYSTQPAAGEKQLGVKPGLNVLAWNLRYDAAETFDGLILWGGGTQGPLAAPGVYKVQLTVGEQVQTGEFEILKDPRSAAGVEDIRAQFDFLIAVRDKLSETHRSIKRLRDVRSQLQGLKQRIGADEKFRTLGEAIDQLVGELTGIEQELYQVQNRSGQDPLNYPIKLNNRLSGLVSVVSDGDNRPTSQATAVRDEVTALIDGQLKQLEVLLGPRLAELNQRARELEVPAIFAGGK